MTRRPELYAPTDADVLDALRFCEAQYGPATTSRVEIMLVKNKGLYSSAPSKWESPVASGAVLRHLKALAERGEVAEVETVLRGGVRTNAKSWVTTERHAARIAERNQERAEAAERRKVLRAAMGALEAHGVQGRIDSPSGVSVPLDGLQRLLADAGWEAVSMEGDEIGAAMEAQNMEVAS